MRYQRLRRLGGLALCQNPQDAAPPQCVLLIVLGVINESVFDRYSPLTTLCDMASALKDAYCREIVLAVGEKPSHLWNDSAKVTAFCRGFSVVTTPKVTAGVCELVMARS